MLKSKRIIIAAILVITMVFSLVGCGGPQKATTGDAAPAGEAPAGTAATVKDTLVVAQSADAKSLDPHASNDSASSNVTRHIYNALLKTDNDMKMVGDLAESWEPVDNLTWKFVLRKGVKWHDGEDFTAKDVKYTIERMKNSPACMHLVEAITEVEMPDDYTVLLHTKTPYAPILANLAHSASRIVSQKSVEKYGDTYGQNPVGTGPYKFVEWVAGEKIVLERFDAYFEGPALNKTLITKPIPEGTSRTIALETGEVDIAYDIEPNDKKRVEENPDTTIIEKESNRVEYVSFNVTKKPFDNQKVRQAISYAIDKASIIEVTEVGRGQIANTVIGPTVFGYNGDLKDYEFNIEKAKQLLTEAGFPDGFETTIWASTDIQNRTAQIIQANLAEIGINAKIELLEWGAYLDRTANGQHDMFLLGWSNLTADADGGMYPLFHSSKKGQSGNRSFYANPEVDKLLIEGRETVDMAVRAEPYKKAQALIMQDAPWVPLYFKTSSLGIRKGLQGVELHPGGMNRFEKAHY